MTDPPLLREEELRQAEISGVVATSGWLLDDELAFTALNGGVVGEADGFALHRSRRLRMPRMDPGERQVLGLGTVVIANVRREAMAVSDGAESAGPLWYTRVWSESNGGWRVLAGHWSRSRGEGAAISA